MKEEIEYRPIPGFEGLYSIGSDGSVLKHKGMTKIKPIQSCYVSDNNEIKYNPCYLIITHNKKKYNFSLAKLVAQVFIPNPNNYKYVDHKDKNKENCRVDNLIWVRIKHRSNTLINNIKFVINVNNEIKINKK